MKAFLSRDDENQYQILKSKHTVTVCLSYSNPGYRSPAKVGFNLRVVIGWKLYFGCGTVCHAQVLAQIQSKQLNFIELYRTCPPFS